MADADRTLYKLVNEQPGPRGIWSDGVLSYVEPGAPAFAELTAQDKALADKHGFLKITKATDAEKKALEAPMSAPPEREAPKA